MTREDRKLINMTDEELRQGLAESEALVAVDARAVRACLEYRQARDSGDAAAVCVEHQRQH